jgi:hypothetical protein
MLWIWFRILICIRLAVLDSDPDPNWESGSECRSMETDENLQRNLVSCFRKDFCMFIGMFFDLQYYLLQICFSFKNSSVCGFKFWPGSAWIRIGLVPWIRIHNEIKSWIQIWCGFTRFIFEYCCPPLPISRVVDLHHFHADCKIDGILQLLVWRLFRDLFLTSGPPCECLRPSTALFWASELC